MNEYNPNKTTWLNPNIEYLFDEDIIEYDMKDAGFSLIKQYQLLPDSKIKELETLEKGFERHKAIGVLQKYDKIFSNSLLNKFAEARSNFISANNISSNDILSVKKDAIFTLKKCHRTKFDNILFSEKNIYSSYIRFTEITNLEIYYSANKVDIKGMGDSAVNRHRLYMLDFIKSVISMIELKDPRIKRYISNFVKDYKTGNIDEIFYLEFNNKSKDFNIIFNYKNIIIPLTKIVIKEMS